MFRDELRSASRTWFGKSGPVVRIAASVQLLLLLGHGAQGEPDQLPLLHQVRPPEQLAAEEVGGHCVATKTEVTLWHEAAGPCVCSLVFHSLDQAFERWFFKTFEHGCCHITTVILHIVLFLISALQLPEFLHKVAPSASKHKHVC